MKCHDAQKYVSAFADGELNTESNLHVLDHLKMCPICAGKVSELQTLRSSLKRAIACDPAPATLRQRILQALFGNQDLPSAGAARHSRTTVWRRVEFPLSLAAAIVMAIGFWQWTLRSERVTNSHLAPIKQVKLAADVRQQHGDCSRMAAKHHRASLGWDQNELRNRLTNELGFRVLAPDLSKWNYQLHSADACGIQGRKAAHVIYQSRVDGHLLSMFSLQRIQGLDDATGNADCATASFGKESVVAWSSVESTHLLLGPDSPTNLCEISILAREAL